MEPESAARKFGIQDVAIGRRSHDLVDGVRVYRAGDAAGTKSAFQDWRLKVATEELAARGEFDITLVNTSVEDVCRQLVTLTMAPSGH